MPYRQNVFTPGNIYHVYNRGINRMPVFVNPGNYAYLLRKVKRLLRELPITVLVYCLMPNHYHFVLRQDGDIPISTFIQRLFQTYTQAFNKQEGRKGPLFEGRFRHVHVDRDEYAIHLCRYVHLNPVTAGLVLRPEAWPYSNYPEWIEVRPGMLVDRAFIRQFFPTPEVYATFVQEHITSELAQQLQPYLLDADDHLPES
jgi:REP element-mobilizing transposase RayT